MSITSMLRDLLRSRSTPARRRAYDDLVARLYKADIAAGALKVGDPAPPFLLPNAEGQLVASGDVLAAGPVVLTFFRGGWCPYCDATMRAMEQALPEITAAGAQLVAIWPDTGGLALRAKRDRRLSYQLLVDVDNAVAMQFGIVFRMPDLYRAVLEEQGIDLARHQGNDSGLLPIPATFVVARNGVIRFAFVDGDFTTRAEPGEIVKAVRALSRM